MKQGSRRGVIRKTHWFVCLFVWWVVAVFFYLFFSAKEGRLIESVTTSGLQTVLESAEKAALPLLERNVGALTRLAREVEAIDGVVNVTIIDHKNKIIAFTNVAQLLPMPATTVKRHDGASYWPYTMSDGTKVVCFSADIVFSGTKIGQVLMAKDGRATRSWTTIFFLSALVSFILIVFILLVAEFNGVRPLINAFGEQMRIWTGVTDDRADGREMTCPLCGCQKPLSRSFLLEANLDRYPIVRSTAETNQTARTVLTGGINLIEISRREDLGWLRKKIIHRCADIIKKLAGD
ncbi:hypothetical protein [Desulfosarcina ovata]|uniref:Uncharacterized protein n=1 Tax=Desulfosarcina ovata subsp. ovata TaxID=2752305 RepID=A0A5K8A792_9BACT|nr:hypothetical protein [Desulfosarcina ovata]BBO88395.1 hypothetical protein DSCOOX_15750 [Desulfosarcina ovata subsp. ovata]